MPQEEAYFIGLLANADSSILPLKLQNGFRIEEIPGKEGFDLFSELEQISKPPHDPFGFLGQVLLGIGTFNVSEAKLFIVRNSFFYERDPDPLSYMAFFKAATDFHNQLVGEYLDPAIHLMRLFKEGDIRMPWNYCYCSRDGKVTARMKSYSYRPVSRKRYHLDTSELERLSQFIHTTKIPFSELNLQLAFENFELSYEIHNPHLTFLTLMVSLETLLNPGGQELTYRISRNLAVLLGKDKKDSEKIYSEIKELYKIRSEIAHSGKSKTLSEGDVMKIRDYVRRAIKQIHGMRMNKEQLLILLNTLGFGEIRKAILT